ncbi:MAG TPA: hypothetical protein VGL58_04665 [Caulobacteraceae bacterium]|jgi:hypothetical protein
MANFTIRIEVRGGSPADDERVAAALEQKGAFSFIIGDDGTRTPMPTGEFNLVSQSATVIQVMNWTREVVDEVAPGAYVFVTEAAGRAWHTGQGAGAG